MESTPSQTLPRRLAAMFASLDKVVRGMKLYEGKGDLVDRLFAELLERMRAATADGAVTVRLAPFGPLFEGKPLLEDTEKRIPYLFQLYCDGVREITFLPTVTDDEVRAFVEVLQTDFRASDDDLVTLLWKRELQGVRTYVVDTFSAGSDPAQDGIAAAADAGTAAPWGQEGAAQVTLTPDDLRTLRSDANLTWVAEARAATRAPARLEAQLAPLRAAFRAGDDLTRFTALALAHADANTPSALVLGMIDAFVAQRRVAELGAVLAAVATAERQGGHAVQALRKAVTSPSRMEALAGVLEAGPDVLLAPLDALAGSDGNVLVPLLLALEPGPAQTALQDLLSRRGIDLTAYYTRQLESPQEQEILEAIGFLGRIKSPAALQALAGALGSVLTKVRHAALQAMVGAYDPEARIALGRVLRDPSKDNRLLALQILRESGDRRAAGLLLSTVQHAQFATREPDEQEAFVLALAAFRDPRTFEYFEKTLAEMNMGRAEATVARQILAARALGEMGDPKAREILEKAKGRWFHPAKVKSAVDQALRSAP